MNATLSEIRKNLEILATAPAQIIATAGGVNQFRLYIKPDPGSWSALDILAHLRACADIWGSSINFMLSEKNPILPDIHPRRYIKQTDYPFLDFSKSIKAFSQQRKEY